MNVTENCKKKDGSCHIFLVTHERASRFGALLLVVILMNHNLLHWFVNYKFLLEFTKGAESHPPHVKIKVTAILITA